MHGLAERTKHPPGFKHAGHGVNCTIEPQSPVRCSELSIALRVRVLGLHDERHRDRMVLARTEPEQVGLGAFIARHIRRLLASWYQRWHGTKGRVCSIRSRRHLEGQGTNKSVPILPKKGQA